MTEYLISISRDDEASVWFALNNDIPIALENGSLDALIGQVRHAVPEMLAENGKLPASGEVQLRFSTECVEGLDCNRYLMSDYENTGDEMSDYIFKRYEEYRDKCVALEQENARLRGERHGSSGMSDYQFKYLMKLKDKVISFEQRIESLRQLVKTHSESGNIPEELLAAIEALDSHSKGRGENE